MISCGADSGCSKPLECLCGVCSKPCKADQACSSLGEGVTCVEHDADSCTTVTKSCDVTCTATSDCRSVSLRHVCMDGLCRIPPPTLGTIDEGGAAGAGSADSAAASGSASGGTTNTGGTVGTGGAAGVGGTTGATVNCDVCGGRDCLLWGTCSKEDACKARGCGGPTVDDNGCQRPDCANDSDCADDSRCVTDFFPVVDQGNNAISACGLSDGLCGCGAYAVNNIVSVCSPTAISGQRGTWLTLRVREWNFQPGDDLTEWLFSSDGSVQVSIYKDNGGDALPELISQETKVAAHPLTKWDAIERLADPGPLRLELADSTPCASVADHSLDVVLELDSGKLQKQVAGCAMESREPFPSLMRLLASFPSK